MTDFLARLQPVNQVQMLAECHRHELYQIEAEPPKKHELSLRDNYTHDHGGVFIFRHLTRVLLLANTIITRS